MLRSSFSLLLLCHLTFVTSLAPKISHCEPSSGQPGSTFYLHGQNFKDLPSLSCRFGALETPVTCKYQSPRHVQCVVPAIAEDIYTLSASNNGRTFSTSSATFQVYIDSSDDDDTRRGAESHNNDGDHSTDENAEFAEAVTQHEGGGIADDDEQASSDEVRVALHLAAWSPVTGNEGDTVTFTAKRVDVGPNPYCRFGTTVIAATRLSSRTLQCTAPNGTGATAVAISNDAVRWSTRRAVFIYSSQATSNAASTVHSGNRTSASTAAAPRVASFVPYRGQAGTVVTVYGSSFDGNSSKLCCRFDKSIVRATFLSASSVRCTAPRHSNGEFHFSVSNDGVAFSAPGRFRFTDVTGKPVLRSLKPTSGHPGTVITLYGANFEDTELLACRFGESNALLSRALYVNSGVVTCIAPNHEPGRVRVEVSCNREYWTPVLPKPVTFAYERDSGSHAASDRVSLSASGVESQILARVDTLTPSRGPAGTTVEVRGTGFVDSEKLLFCRFAKDVVAARFVSRSSILCDAPQRSFPGPVFVEVSIDGAVSFSVDERTFRYTRGIATPTVLAVDPSDGEPGSTVHVYARNVLKADSLYCRFGEAGQVPALYVRSGLVSCSAPNSAILGESVAVSLSNDGISFGSSTGVSFHFTRSVPIVERIVPTRGPPGVLLSVFGKRFRPSALLSCSFRLNSANVFKVRATWLSPEHVRCAVPHSLKGGQYAVALSSDGDLWSTEMISFRVQGLPVPVLKEVEPLSGWQDTAIVVRGDFFYAKRADGSGLRCRVGHRVVAAELIEDGVARCYAPARALAVAAVVRRGDGSIRSAEPLVTSEADRSQKMQKLREDIAAEAYAENPKRGKQRLVDFARLRYAQTDGGVQVESASSDLIVLSRDADLFYTESVTELASAVSVSLELSNDGVHYSSSQFVFTYLPSSALSLRLLTTLVVVVVAVAFCLRRFFPFLRYRFWLFIHNAGLWVDEKLGRDWGRAQRKGV